jgi:uncharacterized membrane protein
MTIRLQEMHPALVHVPITLLPLAVGADLLGRVTGDKLLLSFGQKAICVAAVGAVASAVTGLVAGEEVNVEGDSRDMLMTHRNLNFVATLVAGGMALWRANHQKPNAVYLGTGAVGVGVLAYTAYLGGKLVYGAGVGVEPAHGIYRPDAPALRSGQVGPFIKTAATDLTHGVQHMVQEVGKGQLIPTVMAAFRKQSAVPAGAEARTPA